MRHQNYDFVIAGAGIIGCTVALEIKNQIPKSNILILEKEPRIGMHSSGRNSGVLHAGFYYTEDSLKARFCVDGNRAIKQFCKEHSLKINECGKLHLYKQCV